MFRFICGAEGLANLPNLSFFLFLVPIIFLVCNLKHFERSLMKKITILENKLNSFVLLRNNNDNQHIFDYIDKNIDDIQKQINSLKIKKNHATKKEINLKIVNLCTEREFAENTNDLIAYRKLNKQIKDLRQTLKDLSGDIKFITANQIHSLLKIIGKHSTNVLRDKLLILLGFELGLRASEILDLRKTDIFLETGEILCRRLKGSLKNKIELTDSTNALLKKYLKTFKIETFLFPNTRGNKMTLQGLNFIFKKFCILAKIPDEKAHFHVLKHSRGVWLAENGFSILDIQFLLGHKDIKNTMVYAPYSTIQMVEVFSRLKAIPTLLK